MSGRSCPSSLRLIQTGHRSPHHAGKSVWEPTASLSLSLVSPLLFDSLSIPGEVALCSLPPALSTVERLAWKVHHATRMQVIRSAHPAFQSG
jgi:hypothetical protein